MSEFKDSVDMDKDLEHIEALLRELTTEDATRFKPPVDLWDLIAAETTDADQASASVIDLNSRRRLRMTAVLGAAAAVVVAIAGVVVLGNRGSDDATVLATAQLSYDPAAFDPQGADASATVSLVKTDGRYLIEVDQADLPDPDAGAADLEIWLIHPDADGNPADLVSLGYVDPAKPGEFAVPDAYDPAEFYVVDISVEPRDGVETHSGRSILRGPLLDA